METEKRNGESPPFIDPATGRRRPMTDREIEQYIKTARQAILDLDKITDETDNDAQVWDEILRNLGAI